MKINKQSLEEQVTQYLRQKIVDGEIHLGEKIVESALAKELDLSRSTIRMALNSLAHEGLVIQKPYAGWQVFTLEEADLWELYHMRVALERQAAEMAAEKATAEDKRKLRETLTRFCELCEAAPTDRKGISQADFELHELIVEISGSRRLYKIYHQISNQLRAYISMTHHDYDLSQSGLSHRAMVDAICEGEIEIAGQEATANITTFTELRDKL
ncbi:GntR family transcriptional regulator [Dongshaea marina]|uniref:GntR family transcriptional regulator n=1 Tax=Dongshaea marina TaxID=2047966 RepID=UPI000D3E4FE4|nr:GntR family transcriptional regulator [Dongshaea marina]